MITDLEFDVTEQDHVDAWRERELERAGYPVSIARKLAVRSDIDLHRAVDLVKEGCNPTLASKILL